MIPARLPPSFIFLPFPPSSGVKGQIMMYGVCATILSSLRVRLLSWIGGQPDDALASSRVAGRMVVPDKIMAACSCVQPADELGAESLMGRWSCATGVPAGVLLELSPTARAGGHLQSEKWVGRHSYLRHGGQVEARLEICRLRRTSHRRFP